MPLLRRLQKHLSFANVTSLMALIVATSGVAWAATALPRNSVGASQIKTNAVSRSEIKRSAVAADEVKNASLGGGELQNNTIHGIKVTDGSLGGGDVGDGTLLGADIADGTLALADLAPNSVDGSKVVDGSIGSDDIGDGAVGSSEVGDGAVGSSEVADGSLGGGDVAPGTFLGGKVTVQFHQAPADLPDGTSQSYDVHCPAGQTALGGGFRGDLTESESTVVSSSRPKISEANSSAPVDNGTFNGWRITVLNPPGGITTGLRPELWVFCAALP